MNTEIQIFNSLQFGQLRGMNISGEAWLMATDVARRLGYTNPQKAIRDHVEDDDKTLNESFTVNGTIPVLINESGLYSLILSSKLPQAREFKHWVTSEVLPQIRKTGGYIPVKAEDDEKTILAKAVQILMKTVEVQKQSLEAQRLELAEQDVEIARLAPKAEYAEEVLMSPTCYTMTQVAKSLSMTVQQLQRQLHLMKVIYRSPSGCWMLYADFLKLGYEAYRTKKGENLFGETIWTDTYLVWTEKGKEFIHSLFANE